MQNDARTNLEGGDWMGSELSTSFQPLQGVEGDAEARASRIALRLESNRAPNIATQYSLGEHGLAQLLLPFDGKEFGTLQPQTFSDIWIGQTQPPIGAGFPKLESSQNLDYFTNFDPSLSGLSTLPSHPHPLNSIEDPQNSFRLVQNRPWTNNACSDLEYLTCLDSEAYAAILPVWTRNHNATPATSYGPPAGTKRSHALPSASALNWGNNINAETGSILSSNNAIKNTPYLAPSWNNNVGFDGVYQPPFGSSTVPASSPNLDWEENIGFDMFAFPSINKAGIASPWLKNSAATIPGSSLAWDNNNAGPNLGYLPPPTNSVSLPAPAAAPAPASLPMAGTASIRTGSTLPHRCNVPACNKRFKRPSDLLRHRDTVHLNVRRHLCPIAGCSKSHGLGYSRPDKVTEHLWRKHADLGYTKT